MDPSLEYQRTRTPFPPPGPPPTQPAGQPGPPVPPPGASPTQPASQPGPPVPQAGGKTIRRGSAGPRVAYCQNLLNARLIAQPCLWVDGSFGPKTDARVRQFQASKGLAVDGIVGPNTWAALEAGPPPIKKMP